MSIFDPIYIDHQTDTKLKSLVLNRLDKDRFDELSSHSKDEVWFIQDSELSGQPIVVDTRPVVLPTNLSELSNDVGYCTSAYVTSRGYATESWVNNKNYATQSYVQTYVADHTSKTAWRDWFQTEGDFDGLTFTAEEANSTVAMQKSGSAPSVSLEYTTDGSTWNDFIVGTTTVTLANVGDKMVLRAKTTNATFATSSSNENKFVMTGKIAASKSIMYLLKKDGDSDVVPDYGFTHLFQGCASLTSPPDLPATTLGRNCYEGMLQQTSISAIEIPDAELKEMCYYWMLDSCNQLHEIKIGYTGNFSGSGVPIAAFNSWVYRVPSTGTFYYNGSDTSRGSSAIPTGWTVQTF